jgi:hypothetical protein
MAGRSFEAGLQLLDRQLIDEDGKHAGKVDDLEHKTSTTTSEERCAGSQVVLVRRSSGRPDQGVLAQGRRQPQGGLAGEVPVPGHDPRSQ